MSATTYAMTAIAADGLGHVDRVDLVDRVGRRVVDQEVVPLDLERHRRQLARLDARPDVGAAARGTDLVGLDAARAVPRSAAASRAPSSCR